MNGWPSRSRASATSPASTAARIRLDEQTSPCQVDRLDPGDRRSRYSSPSISRRSTSPARAIAEAEVVADHGMTDAEPAGQHVVDELLGRLLAQLPREGEREQVLDAQLGEQARLDAERRQARRRVVRRQDLARMRLEGDHAERRAEHPGPLAGRSRSGRDDRDGRHRNCRSPRPRPTRRAPGSSSPGGSACRLMPTCRRGCKEALGRGPSGARHRHGSLMA